MLGQPSGLSASASQAGTLVRLGLVAGRIRP
jgi:hypothetical protein